MLRDALNFLRISRPSNVLISFLAFGVAAFISQDKSWAFLTDSVFWATALCIIVIAASGYWINDVYDFRIDRVNKPGKTIVNAYLSVKKVLTVYFFVIGGILLFSFVFLGFISKLYHIFFINALSVALLFFYASYLKRIGVPGNLSIAFLIALVILLAGYLYEVNSPLVWTMIFAFEITLIREITKDVEDIRGDLQFELRTLPIQIGIRRTKYILQFFYICFLLSCYIPFIYAYFRVDKLIWPYIGVSFLLVQLPTVYVMYLLANAVKPEDFGKQSRYLKYIMLGGIASLFFLY
ncbi:MAG: geranylgeranylglycerol-phosphate geranylgeranyltransferase [Bacteroidota bacterium]